MYESFRYNYPNGKMGEAQPVGNKEKVENFCPFCDGLDSDSRFYQQYPELEGYPQILYQTESVMVLPDLAPVKSGHVLIVPKQHVTSHTCLDDSCRREFAQVYDFVKEKLGKPDTLEFEHGSGFLNDKQVACGNSVFHAHWHVIPVSGQVEGIKILDKMLDEIPSDMQFQSFGHEDVTNSERFLMKLSESSDNHPYLVFRNADWAVVFREEDELAVPSQILRRITALVLHGERGRWNWKDATDDDKNIWLQNLKQIYQLFGHQV